MAFITARESKLEHHPHASIPPDPGMFVCAITFNCSFASSSTEGIQVELSCNVPVPIKFTKFLLAQLDLQIS